MVGLIHARYNPDTVKRTAELEWARRQADYALGSTGRSYVCGWWNNFPQQPHHIRGSCPAPPAPCGWNEYNSPAANPNVLEGAMVAGPGGVKLMKDYAKKNPPIIINEVDDTYFDVRSDYEVRYIKSSKYFQ
jgi:hypothetical protein